MGSQSRNMPSILVVSVLIMSLVVVQLSHGHVILDAAAATTTEFSVPGANIVPGIAAAQQSIIDNLGVQAFSVKDPAFLDMPWRGRWEIVNPDSGVSSMHIQLMPNNKLIMFDATSLGNSMIQLPPNNCRPVPGSAGKLIDCFAHSVEFDLATMKVRPLKVLTDPWCSCGGLAPDGTLVGTGGWADGGKTMRYMDYCQGKDCDWRESKILLSDIRWYATQTILANGEFMVFGGRRAFNYEFIAPEGKPSPGKVDFPFLFQTTDLYENNLYPFIHLAPDGNLFILANFRSILFNPFTNTIIREYPELPGGARNYPGSACSAILTIVPKFGTCNDVDDIEILVCGGGQPTAFGKADKEQIFLPALDTCGRIKVMDPKANWDIETMPSPRVMGAMHNLPNGDLIILNGAKKGASGWQFADDPNLDPILYSPEKPKGARFTVLEPTTIPRMYHSTSALVPDGRILVAGSNTNPKYDFKAKFPTELRVEMFYPPYLDLALADSRPTIDAELLPKEVKYNLPFFVPFKLVKEPVRSSDFMVTIYRPPFTTHGYSMDQRLLELRITGFSYGLLGKPHTAVVKAPGKPEVAPPGYYLLFVNFKGVPSIGVWIKLVK